MTADLRVLVVDDHAMVRRGLRDFLEGDPELEVVGEAADGDGALDALAALDAEGRRPGVVLMDLQMGPVDGIEATRRIRDRYADVEVVALSSFADQGRVQAAFAAGAAAYILKDADAEAIVTAVRAASRGQLTIEMSLGRALLAQPAPGDVGPPPVHLTDREREILRLVAAGMANKEIAAQLVISERTARSHVSSILGKLGLASRTQAALWAIHAGLVEEP